MSFSAGVCKGSFSVTPDPSLSTSLGESWSFYKYVGGGQTGVTFPTTVKNPNKAIVTVNAKTSEVSNALFIMVGGVAGVSICLQDDSMFFSFYICILYKSSKYFPKFLMKPDTKINAQSISNYTHPSELR